MINIGFCKITKALKQKPFCKKHYKYIFQKVTEVKYQQEVQSLALNNFNTFVVYHHIYYQSLTDIPSLSQTSRLSKDTTSLSHCSAGIDPPQIFFQCFPQFSASSEFLNYNFVSTNFPQIFKKVQIRAAISLFHWFQLKWMVEVQRYMKIAKYKCAHQLNNNIAFRSMITASILDIYSFIANTESCVCCYSVDPMILMQNTYVRVLHENKYLQCQQQYN